jgi:anti-anti-sigma factor
MSCAARSSMGREREYPMRAKESRACASIMLVKAERVASAMVLDVEGRLTVEVDTRRLHDLVRAAARHGPRNVVLDLGRVWQLDCSGIRQLVQLNDHICRSGGVLALVNVERHLRHLLEMVGLPRILPLFESREAAIVHCQGGVSARQDALPQSVAAKLTRTAPHRADDARELAHHGGFSR